MFHNHTNQLPLYILNRTPPSDPPPRYSQTEQSTPRLDSSFVCLTLIFALCLLVLIFLLVLGQVFILTHLENISESCSTINLDNWEVRTQNKSFQKISRSSVSFHFFYGEPLYDDLPVTSKILVFREIESFKLTQYVENAETSS